MLINRDLAIREHRTAAGVLVVALLVTWLAYSPGMGGSLHFDDHPNLVGLEDVIDAKSAFRFIATGESGPLGRPIALASFVPQAYAWPDSPEAFLRINILIHLINGILVTWFLYLLALSRGTPEQQAALTGTASGALWMFMPILASSSLMIVQRMTTLSATFVLLGAIAYLYSRRASSRRPLLALLAMTLSIGIGATFGALTKENGALLVLFIIAFESTLLDRPPGVSGTLWRAWFTTLLALPTAILASYLLTQLPYSEVTVLMRDFNGIERLLTQAQVLWKYLYLSFLPNSASFGPFHDDYVINRTLDGTTLLAVSAWIGVISAAIYLRRKAPLFSFAVAWYLLGHSMESSSIPLELYFEHRNYLPLIGPTFAVVSFSSSLARRWPRTVPFVGMLYSVMLIAVLFSITSLWGTPRLASEIWHTHKPGSTRAVQNLAGQLELENDHWASRKVLSRFAEANPHELAVRFQALSLACVIDPNANHQESIHDLERQLSIAKYRHGIDQAMQSMLDLIRKEKCSSITDEALYQLGNRLLRNPNYNIPFAKHHIHLVLAQIGLHRQDLDLTITHLQEALALSPNLVTLGMLINVQDSAGLFDLSNEALREARRWRPLQPLKARNWRKKLEEIEYSRNVNVRSATPELDL
jgi:protein O-mannosyl-transferase